ncbi:hypothetical protein HanIR_Chr16g0830841 [Helianthus annuus]|nr:hypothetical protein HanIR_Chr16g0830841 [Helianthus annuus]
MPVNALKPHYPPPPKLNIKKERNKQNLIGQEARGPPDAAIHAHYLFGEG